MAGRFVNTGGVWNKVSKRYDKVGGIYQPVKKRFVKVGGIWQPSFKAYDCQAHNGTYGGISDVGVISYSGTEPPQSKNSSRFEPLAHLCFDNPIIVEPYKPFGSLTGSNYYCGSSNVETSLLICKNSDYPSSSNILGQRGIRIGTNTISASYGNGGQFTDLYLYVFVNYLYEVFARFDLSFSTPSGGLTLNNTQILNVEFF